MKKNVTRKARKQIDELVDRLKKNEILNSPAIQSLVEKAQKIAPLPQVAIVSGQSEDRNGDVATRSKARTKKSRTMKASSQQLLDLIATNEVANRIAERVLAQATEISNKVKANVKEIKKVAKATRKKVERAAGVSPVRAKAAAKTKNTVASKPRPKRARKS